MNLTKTKIKKVWSENPRLTKTISMKTALDGYYKYIGYCLEQHARDIAYAETRKWVDTPEPMVLADLKTFSEWRTTEISPDI